MDKQVTIEECMITRLRGLLLKCSLLADKRAKPMILYRKVIEENEDVIEEEIASIANNLVIVQVLTYGCMIEPTIQQQFVIDLYEFPEWLMRRGRDIFEDVLTNLSELE